MWQPSLYRLPHDVFLLLNQKFQLDIWNRPQEGLCQPHIGWLCTWKIGRARIELNKHRYSREYYLSDVSSRYETPPSRIDTYRKLSRAHTRKSKFGSWAFAKAKIRDARNFVYLARDFSITVSWQLVEKRELGCQVLSLPYLHVYTSPRFFASLAFLFSLSGSRSSFLHRHTHNSVEICAKATCRRLDTSFSQFRFFQFPVCGTLALNNPRQIGLIF